MQAPSLGRREEKRPLAAESVAAAAALELAPHAAELAVVPGWEKKKEKRKTNGDVL